MYQVMASYKGDAKYAGVDAKYTTLTITKKEVTITPNAQTPVYFLSLIHIQMCIRDRLCTVEADQYIWCIQQSIGRAEADSVRIINCIFAESDREADG